MTRLPGLVVAALAVALLAGCPKRAAVKPPATARAALDSALARVEANDYARAEEAMTWVIFNFPGSREAADAQYWLAETHFRRRDYSQAQTEFEFYIKSFPNGRYAEDANYKLGLSWLRSAPAGARDQAPVLKARELLSDFIQLYPDSPLRPEAEQALAEIERHQTGRDFDVAGLYFRAGEYRSALVYYRYIAGSLPVERWEPVERLRYATCLAENGAAAEARPLLESLLAGGCPARLREQAQSLLGRLE
ncbi:MAG: outer membrane protein assembly factor BamD [bacterium]